MTVVRRVRHYSTATSVDFVMMNVREETKLAKRRDADIKMLKAQVAKTMGEGIADHLKEELGSVGERISRSTCPLLQIGLEGLWFLYWGLWKFLLGECAYVLLVFNIWRRWEEQIHRHYRIKSEARFLELCQLAEAALED